MGVFEKIARFVGSETALQAAVGAALGQCYARALHNGQRLRKLAELAPNSNSMQMLNELAASEESVTARLLEALTAARTPAPRVPSGASAATNHWARLVEVLEAHRSFVQILRELVPEFDDSFPTTAELFGELRNIEAMHCEQLRGLIARADPQAAD